MIRAALLLFLVFGTCLSAAPKEGQVEVLTTAQSFYDGYMKLATKGKDSESYVLKSAAVTDTFKKAYKIFMKDADSDPIICGQDFPDAGFEATKPVIKGASATVTMKSRDASFKHSFSVFLQKTGKGWQIDGTESFKAKG